MANLPDRHFRGLVLPDGLPPTDCVERPLDHRRSRVSEFVISSTVEVLCLRISHRKARDLVRPTRGMKEEWEKLYRIAVLESDRSKLPERIKDAQAAMLERSRRLADSPEVDGHARDAIARALHILSLLSEVELKL